MKGKIIITDKVYFEPDGLPKPLLEAFKERLTVDDKIIKFKRRSWEYAMKAYEASKQLIEVENVVPHLIPRLNEQKVDVYYDVIFSDYNFEQIKDNQNCKAKIKGESATIIELL